MRGQNRTRTDFMYVGKNKKKGIDKYIYLIYNVFINSYRKEQM